MGFHITSLQKLLLKPNLLPKYMRSFSLYSWELQVFIKSLVHAEYRFCLLVLDGFVAKNSGNKLCKYCPFTLFVANKIEKSLSDTTK